MRCRVCDQLLNEWEIVRKDPETKEYLDTCSYCLSMSKPEVVDFIETENKYLETVNLGNKSIDLSKEM